MRAKRDLLRLLLFPAVLGPVLVGLPATASPASPSPASTAAGASSHAPSGERYIVRFGSGTSVAEGAGIVRRNGGSVERTLTHVFAGAIGRMSSRAAEALLHNPHVAAVEADQRVRLTDAQSPAAWGLDRVDQGALPLDRTYHYSASGKGVTAYVVDTGIRSDHVDFGGRVSGGYTTVADGNGTEDCAGHGTHVAGTIGSTTYGMAKSVTLVPVRVLDCDGSGYMSDVVAGLDWVIGQHQAGTPAVANLSLGGGPSSTVDAAVRATVQDGVTVVVAAGNSSADACTSSPAREPSALTVGATSSSDARASFSNYGSCLDLFAPGVNIVSTYDSSPTATAVMSGTSMASPHVAGAAADLLQAAPAATPAEIAQRLTSTATRGSVTGAGTGSPNRLLFADPGLLQAPSPVTVPGAPSQVSASAADASARVRWVAATTGGTAIDHYTVTASPGGVVATVPGSSTTATVHGLANGTTYTFTVRATNAVGTGDPSAPSNPVTPAVAPDTRIDAGPAEGSVVTRRSVRFGYSSDTAGVTFLCTLDGAARACGTSSFRTGRLPAGTHTFTVAARSSDGALDSTPARRTLTVPVDDKLMRHSSGWGQRGGRKHFRRTVSETSRHGRELTTRMSSARAVSLVATTGPGRGRVGVYLGSHLLRRVDLASTVRQVRRVVPVASWSTAHHGRLTIRVVSRAGSVQIDGIGFSVAR